MAHPKLTIIQSNLGYEFKDLKLLQRALTHCSAQVENNERLEFVGDAVVNFVIAEALYLKLPKAKEGTLSRIRSNLVNGKTLSAVAKEKQIGEHLLLSFGERKTGGAERPSILADALEAIIAAIYLDSDMETCRNIVLGWFNSRLEQVTMKSNIKDAKTNLQEYLQAHKMSLPEYTITDTTGESHAQTFTVVCRVPEIDYETTGTGTSRRRAEQHAAGKFFDFLLNELSD